MSLSSFCVVSNALRLNLVDIYNSKKDKKKVKELKEITMSEQNKKTLTIEGMMCEHCEKRVKDSLEKLDKVSEAVVSHKTKSAIVSLNGEVENDVLKKTVEDQGYKVLDIK